MDYPSEMSGSPFLCRESDCVVLLRKIFSKRSKRNRNESCLIVEKVEI
jgi:hypothetical protein